MAGQTNGAVLDGFYITDGSYRQNQLDISAPSSIAGKYVFGLALFGPSDFELQGSVVMANPEFANTPLDNPDEDVAGKIVLVKRGVNTFSEKAYYAQQKGAIGVIIYNNVEGAINTMGAGVYAAEITIPVVSLSQADGEAVRSALDANEEVLVSMATYTLGSAIHISGSNNVVDNCQIRTNNSINGAVTMVSAQATFTNCVFLLNSVYGSGTVHCISSKAVFNQCTFSNNWAQNNGAAVNASNQSDVSFKDCYFNQNSCYANGGAVASSNSILLLDNCEFIENSSNNNGGALFINNNSNAKIVDSKFNGNEAPLYGGAICTEYASLDVNRCNINNNISQIGGGIMGSVGSNIIITNSLFEENQASGGGAGANFSICQAIISNSAFINNTANGSGGAIGTGGAFQLSNAAQVEAINCLMAGNKAEGYSDDGGGAVMVYEGSLNLTNCTLFKNNTVTYGGALRSVDPTSVINITNSIIWGNSASLGDDAISATAAVNYSLVQGEAVYEGTGNLNSDPLFVDETDFYGADGLLMTDDDGLSIQSISAAKNSGDPSLTAPELDITGKLRIDVADIGAYEALFTTNLPLIKSEITATIYPNPASSYLIISDVNGANYVQMTDVNGMVVWQGKPTSTPIDVSGLANGVYFVKIFGQTEKWVSKIIINKSF